MEQIRVAIATVGCRANQADSAAITRHLDSRIVTVVNSLDRADVVIVNTCCVTGEAERDCRKITRRALRSSDKSRILLIGCTVNAFPKFGEELGKRVTRMTGEDAMPLHIAEWIHRLREGAIEGSPKPISTRALGRTRALVKVQNGCTHHCSYCIVPKARGKEKSAPLPEVLREIEHLKTDGFKEIVLTGVQLGAWGRDLPGNPTIADLVRAAADAVYPGRIRLSSIEPWSVDKTLVKVVANHPRICPHFHIPLQNGDDGILNAMGRGYRAEEFVALASIIRESLPNAAIGTDVLLGFPGETEDAFQNTVTCLERVRPAYVHAFSFSPRPGTRAAKFPNRPNSSDTRSRTRKIRELGAQWADDFRASQIGTAREIIVEDITKKGAFGITDNYVGVHFLDDAPSPGSLVRARLVQNPKDTEKLGAIEVEI